MFLFDLAPGRGYLAAALLHAPVVSYTTISPLPVPSPTLLAEGKSQSRWYVSVARSDRLPFWASPSWVLPGAMLYGVQTFLGTVKTVTRSPDQPGQTHHTRIKINRQS